MEEENKSFLDSVIDRKTIGVFLNKIDYAGKELKAEIKGVDRNRTYSGKVVLELELETGESGLLSCGPTNQNQLIDLFGNYPKDWIGQSITLAFSKLKTFPIERDGIKTEQEGVSFVISEG